MDNQQGDSRDQTSLTVRDQNDDQNVCVGWCMSEFESDNVTLDYDRPIDLVTSQWAEGRPRFYLLYRTLVALVLIGWLAGDIVYESSEFYVHQAWRWLVFASNWSFALLALSASVQALTSVIYEYRPYWIVDPIYIRTMPTVLKLQWILFNISNNSALVVTTGYWAFIAFVADTQLAPFIVGNWDWKKKPLLTSDMSRLKHTMNSIYVIADVMISATPVRVYHLFFTVFLGSLYIVFNALYFINNGSVLIKSGPGTGGRTYYFMNWSQPVEAICTCVLGVMMCAAAQFLLHGLYQLRQLLSRRMSPGRPGGVDSELQNIMGSSSSYNSLDEGYGERWKK